MRLSAAAPRNSPLFTSVSAPFPPTCTQNGIYIERQESTCRLGLRPEREVLAGSRWFVVRPSGGKSGWNKYAASGRPTAALRTNSQTPTIRCWSELLTGVNARPKTVFGRSPAGFRLFPTGCGRSPVLDPPWRDRATGPTAGLRTWGRSPGARQRRGRETRVEQGVRIGSKKGRRGPCQPGQNLSTSRRPGETQECETTFDRSRSRRGKVNLG